MYVCSITQIGSSPLFFYSFSVYFSPLLMVTSIRFKTLYSFLYREYINHILSLNGRSIIEISVWLNELPMTWKLKNLPIYIPITWYLVSSPQMPKITNIRIIFCYYIHNIYCYFWILTECQICTWVFIINPLWYNCLHIWMRSWSFWNVNKWPKFPSFTNISAGIWVQYQLFYNVFSFIMWNFPSMIYNMLLISKKT
jgi:hypothetical protein